jgi:hypothetical protein
MEADASDGAVPESQRAALLEAWRCILAVLREERIAVTFRSTEQLTVLGTLAGIAAVEIVEGKERGGMPEDEARQDAITDAEWTITNLMGDERDLADE